TARQEADNPFAPLMEQNVFGKLTHTPAGEDPAFYPIKILNDFNYWIVNRKEIKNNPGGLPYAKFGEYMAPMRESIRIVKTAYEILAYPHCKDRGRRECIEDELVQDQYSFERDEVELNDDELRALGKLAAARKIPFDPQKRLYKYSEVLKSHQS